MRPFCVAAALLCLTAGFGPAAEPRVEIKIIYDNTAASPEFLGDWGFSALVTAGGHNVLFDSGSDATLFLQHLKMLGIEPSSISHALISHHHADHREGIYRLALRNPSMQVLFLDSFPSSTFEVAMAVGISPVRVSGPMEILPGIYTTGPVEAKIPEQALVIETSEGPVVLVGGSHPGAVRMVEVVREQRGEEKIRLLLGGFHTLRESEEEVQARIERLKELGVERVAPMHGTGEKAKRLFRQAWGNNYLAGGAGRTIVLE
jgi:7,8-dihydropterin-6-yl-methyl-4-(beta-D-ribofuranosyl)aminobenzene 5'-phosphate synthase